MNPFLLQTEVRLASKLIMPLKLQLRQLSLKRFRLQLRQLKQTLDCT
uniref:Uncharacterized protein n=1 Tax=Romanomermis culicivorax TaxID=13658 RepID=A0A915IDM7_ROMCU